MAGFEFEIEFSRSEEPLIRGLLRALRRRTDGLDLEMWVESRETGKLSVFVDGRLPMMQVLFPRVEVDFPAFAEGFPGPPGLAQRSRATERVVSELQAAVRDMAESLDEVMDMFHGLAIHLYFDPGRATHLSKPLRAFSTALVQYAWGNVTTEQALEQAHTVMELLLRSSLKDKGRGMSFEGMVRQAYKERLLAPHLETPLIQLKDFRKLAKHRGQGVPQTKARPLLEGAIEGSQQLVKYLRMTT